MICEKFALLYGVKISACQATKIKPIGSGSLLSRAIEIEINTCVIEVPGNVKGSFTLLN